MQIFVKLLTEGTIALEVETSDTIEELKTKIAKHVDIPVALQRLAYVGLCLQDDKMLSQYKIEKQATLSLEAPGLPGGRKIKDQYLRYLALMHNLNKKICRKCYARLPPSATRCRQAKCGRTSNIRPKKSYYMYEASGGEFASLFRHQLSLKQ